MCQANRGEASGQALEAAAVGDLETTEEAYLDTICLPPVSAAPCSAREPAINSATQLPSVTTVTCRPNACAKAAATAQLQVKRRLP